jgi:transcriptional regulator with XRE-family HTH domain
MEQDATPLSPTQVVAKRVREVRQKRGLTAAQLAEQMARVGVPWKRGVVAKLESGLREAVSVEELLALAYVLDVAPVHLLVPFDDDAQPYQVTPTQVEKAGFVRDWIRGDWYLDGTDVRNFFSELPPHEFLPPDRRGGRGIWDPMHLSTYAARLGQDPEWLRSVIEEGGPGAASARKLLAALESKLESEQQQAPDG